MKKIKTTITCLVLGISMTTIAQEKIIKRGNQQWIQYYNQTKLSEKWIWLSDGGFRWKDAFNQSSQYIVRTGFGYNFNPNMSMTIGFAHQGFYASDKLNKVEFRPYQEFAILNKCNSIGIQHRYRVEERYFRNVAGGNIQSTSNFRFRYRLMLDIPIMNLSSTNSDRKLSLNVGDEIFINAGSEIVYNVFDQNRILIGPAIQFSKTFTITITYNSQFAAANSAGEYNYTNVIWLGIKHKLDFTNPEKPISE